ncbi:MAG: PQQ-binding-like beta-propeller repeat protein [Thermoplasmata archaeon]|nr:MAG: PQQ-binding-like beta-propeller repeat protein [Thermoplasmata archaeon]
MRKKASSIFICLVMIMMAFSTANNIDDPSMDQDVGEPPIGQTFGQPLSSSSPPTEWPMFHRTPDSNGFTPDAGPTNHPLLWSKGLQANVKTSPAAVDGRVYVNGFLNSVSALYCLDAETGATLWRYIVSEGRISTAPCVSDGKVYFGKNWGDGKFYCLDAYIGSLIWEAIVGDMYIQGAVVVDDVIYIPTSRSGIYALYASNGTQIWEISGGSMHAGVAVDGDVLYGISSGLKAVNRHTGATIWTYPTGFVYSTPAVAYGKVFVQSYNGYLYAVHKDTGALIWSYNLGVSNSHGVQSSPAAGYNSIFVGCQGRSDGNNFLCFDPDNGNLLWSVNTGGNVLTSAAIAGNNLVYIASSRLYAINVTYGTKLWNHYLYGSSVVASPAIYNGVVYITSVTTAYAIGNYREPPPTNQPPVADAGSDQTVNVGDLVQFDGSGSYDPDGNVTFYDWDFGDGSPHGSGMNPTHVYNISGDYTVTLTVWDDDNASDDDTCIITVHSVGNLPTANAGLNHTINEGEEAIFNVSGSYDPDGYIVKYELDFGDGTNYTWLPSATNVTGTDILVYVTRTFGAYNRTFFNEDLPRILEEEGFDPLISGPDHIEDITSDILENYDQLWILSTNFSSHGIFSTSEIDAILDFQANGGGVLVMADHVGGGLNFAADANQVSTNFGVTFSGFVNHGHRVIDPFIVDHPLNEDVDTIWGHWSEADLSVTNPDVDVIAIHSGYEMIAVLDVEGEGKMVFDTSFTRMEDGDDPNGHHILQGDNVQYAKNIAKWLGMEFAPEAPPLINHTYGDDGLGTNGIYTMTLTVTDNEGNSATDTCVVTVNNVNPTVDSFGPFVVNEGSPLTLSAIANDQGSDDLIFTWNFEDGPTIVNSYFNDGMGPDPYPSPFGIFPFSAADDVEHTYGDDGVYSISLKVEDDDKGAVYVNTTVTVNNMAPGITIMATPSGDEGSSLTFQAEATDSGSDDLTFEWDFEYGPTIKNTYYNDGAGPEPVYDPLTNEIKSPDGLYPFIATDTVNHNYGDDYNYTLILRVTDDDGGTSTYTTTISIYNLAPSITLFAIPLVVFEGIPSTFIASAKDHGSDDLNFEWDFGDSSSLIKNTYYNDGIAPDSDPSPDGTFPFIATDTLNHTYGDDYNYTLSLKVTDDDGGATTFTTTVTVQNVDPTIESVDAYMHVNFTLRVAGEKWHSVNITLYENDTEIWSAGITRQPGSPDEQAATLTGHIINFGCTYHAVVDYLPNDPRVNGNFWGGTPVWIILEFQDGTSERLHHTFNVRQSDWDSDHWNHIDPWEVDLTGIFYMHNITLEATASDPGSDDLIFNWEFGDGDIAGPNKYFNDGLGPDPYPSPEGIFPFSVTDIVTHIYSGPETIILTVSDDDGGTTSITIDIL